MAAYIIAEHQITDPAKFEEYRTKVGPMNRETRRALSDQAGQPRDLREGESGLAAGACSDHGVP
jgi:uncharacterized protein (DUF1330 family)